MLITKDDIGRSVWHRLSGKEYIIESLRYCHSTHSTYFACKSKNERIEDENLITISERGTRFFSRDTYPIVSWVKEEYRDPPKPKRTEE